MGGFGEAVTACFRKYAMFRGRARRMEYWYFVLFSILVSIPVAFVDKLVSPNADRGPVESIVSLVLLLPQLSVTVRRLRDSGRSGWWLGGLVLYAVVGAGAFLMAVLGPAGRGSKGPTAEIIPFVILAVGAAYLVWMFVLTVLPGTPGPNRYGPDPRLPATAPSNA
jgi:uncharacterized membrane protein YhaH (DUF805 family)